MTEESKNHPLVSVILTSYNYETFIQEAIESVFDQTYRPMELIIGAFVAVIGLCYLAELLIAHVDWGAAAAGRPFSLSAGD